MKLVSNIRVVIQRLDELQAGYPSAIRRALAPEYWTPQLTAVARQTLEAMVASLPSDTEAAVQTRARLAQLIPVIADTVTGTLRPEGSLFSMWLPPNSVSDLDFGSAARFAADQWTPTGRAKKWAMPNPASEENLRAARQAVLDWVTLEKTRDERDRKADGSYLSNEQIAERVETVLGLRPAMHGRNAEMDAAADELRGAIQAWLDGESSTPGGTPVQAPSVNRPRGTGFTAAQARQWLGAVLAAWVAFARAHLRDRVQEELTKLHLKIKAPQQELI